VREDPANEKDHCPGNSHLREAAAGGSYPRCDDARHHTANDESRQKLHVGFLSRGQVRMNSG
jgi:hypothetical protein